MNTALGTKKSGMVLLSTVAFSGVASQNLPASTFTSAYENYDLLLSCVGSTTLQVYMYLRAGSTNTTTGYPFGGLQSNYAGTLASQYSNSNRGEWPFAKVNTARAFSKMTISNPSSSANGVQMIYHQLSPADGMLSGSGRNNSGIAFDSAQIFVDTGNITGTISVYGWNK
jgi:hypothetical protein